MQRVQNTAARLVLDVPHSSPSQPLSVERCSVISVWKNGNVLIA